ncbi:hypothetical protein [Spirillospora sp. NBC_01491]|uniref:hypothetical protein n=1 Tax=Spirillospora sp. NBC_01491 TaxID=2976007 RepID=UPI002E358D14|nr:hypothetical protein [Spirillospora sp. NBC_01491]
MFHSDITYSIMTERARDLRAAAEAARDVREMRRARRFWEERALPVATRRPRRSPAAGTGTGRTVTAP